MDGSNCLSAGITDKTKSKLEQDTLADKSRKKKEGKGWKQPKENQFIYKVLNTSANDDHASADHHQLGG